jgi:hypothetical protein
LRARTLLTAVALLAIAVPVASAAAPTRDEYKAQVEPICKANTKANERILANVRKQVKAGQLTAAGGKFAKAAAELKATLGELRAVPQPSADKSRLTKWLGYVADEADLFAAAAAKLKEGEKAKAQRMVVDLIRTANSANAQVLSFEFTYCRLDPSKFT